MHNFDGMETPCRAAIRTNNGRSNKQQISVNNYCKINADNEIIVENVKGQFDSVVSSSHDSIFSNSNNVKGQNLPPIRRNVIGANRLNIAALMRDHTKKMNNFYFVFSIASLVIGSSALFCRIAQSFVLIPSRCRTHVRIEYWKCFV